MTDIRVVETVEEARSEIGGLPRPLGLVPTMGFLHAGHMALVHRARAESASLVASIFVNPAQFGPHDDYATYPRDMASDLAELESASVDLVFAPPANEMYPGGFDTYVDVGHLAERLEGAARPGHFRGVATVVCKLLAIVRPDRAYFGQKDAQQSLVVKRLNADLNLGAEIVVVPTVREPDGLALSSRNVFLTQEERQAALALYRSLCLARAMKADGVTDGDEIRRQMRETIESEPLVRVDYVSVADPEMLEEIDAVTGPALALVAARVGKARLIDNMPL